MSFGSWQSWPKSRNQAHSWASRRQKLWLQRGLRFKKSHVRWGNVDEPSDLRHYLEDEVRASFMIIFIIHSNHSFLSIDRNGWIVADQINQVAKAMETPTSFRPWKPNCQMTPNQEDIIGGRSSVSDSISIARWWEWCIFGWFKNLFFGFRPQSFARTFLWAKLGFMILYSNL